MSDLVKQAKDELKKCKTTGDVRKLSARLFRNLGDKSKENVFRICGELLEQRDWAMGVIAFDFAYRVRKQYDENTFYLFEGWLHDYVSGWGECDDFCTHAFGELIIQQPYFFSKVKEWTKCDQFWMRRASAVVLIPAIHQDTYNHFNVLEISDALMSDEHDLVRKGYGWMLKILATKEPEIVIQYLIKNHKTMPRVSFRYAMEKLGKEQKDFLMKL